MTNAERRAYAASVLADARAKGLMIATAESCTGGMVAAALTDIPGSSDVVDRGFVTYSNAAKTEMLGVSPALIAAHGAVSAEVAAAMALGALKHSRASVAVAITGVAGPGGGTDDKPVGLVHFAVAARDGQVFRLEKRLLGMKRDTIRRHARDTALVLLSTMIGETRHLA